MPPNFAIACEGEICENINIVIDGRVDVYRKIKENIDNTGKGKKETDEDEELVQDFDTMELDV